MLKEIDAVPSINVLPNEILVLILEQLPFENLLRMTEVCRRWNELVFNFFGDHILLRLNENYERSVGLLTNRIYRNIAATWDRKRSKWMTVVERFSTELICLSIDVEPCNEDTERLWRPSDVKIEEFCNILAKLKTLKELYVVMRLKVFDMLERKIFGLTSLEFLSIVIVDAGHYSASPFDFYLLPNLQRLFIENGDLLRISPKPCPLVKDLILSESLLGTSFQVLSKVFPNLKELNIEEIVINNKQLTSIVKAWPQLEILNFGLCPSLLKHFRPELLQQLPNLRKLILEDVTSEDPKYDRRSDFNFEYPQNYSLLEPIFRIPTLEELYIADYDINWEGELKEVAALGGCRVYTRNQFHVDYERCV